MTVPVTQKLCFLERRGPAAWLFLNRPTAAHALSTGLVRALCAAIATLSSGELPAALVIAATGNKVFCAGADLKERLRMSLDETRDFLDELGALLLAIERFPRPVIAALSGAAHGGGLELALACDFRIAAEHAVFSLPEVRLGIIPGAGGTQRLARLLGVAVAKDLVLTGRRVEAHEAAQLKLVSRVVLPSELESEVGRWVDHFAAAGPLALAQAKQAIDAGYALSLADAIALERSLYEVVLQSHDRNEGLQAFAEKRPPRFSGR